jgi:hypothetical protein
VSQAWDLNSQTNNTQSYVRGFRFLTSKTRDVLVKKKDYWRLCNMAKIRLVGGPPTTSATNWPIVHGPGDYEAGEFGGTMTGKGNRSTRRKPAPVQLCPQQIPHDLTGREPGRRGEKPATNRVSYGTAM